MNSGFITGFLKGMTEQNRMKVRVSTDPAYGFGFSGFSTQTRPTLTIREQFALELIEKHFRRLGEIVASCTKQNTVAFLDLCTYLEFNFDQSFDVIHAMRRLLSEDQFWIEIAEICGLARIQQSPEK